MKKVTRFKGVSLFEVVISILIYGVIALLLVEIMNTVNYTARSTRVLNERLAYEQKFADNRLTEADSQGSIDFKGAHDLQIELPGYSDPISASGLVYKINYNSGSEYASANDVNYRYMVFDYHESGDEINYDIPFFIPLEFEGGKSKYTIKSIELFEVDSEGNVSNSPLSATLSCPEFEFIGTDLRTKKSGEEVIMKENVERIHGSVADAYQLIVNRKPKGSPNGNGSVMVVLRADITSETGSATPVDIKNPDTGEVIGRSDNYPLLRFQLDYTAWTVNKKDDAKTESSFYYYPMLKFIVKSNYTIESQSLSFYEPHLYEYTP